MTKNQVVSTRVYYDKIKYKTLEVERSAFPLSLNIQFKTPTYMAMYTVFTCTYILTINSLSYLS